MSTSAQTKANALEGLDFIETEEDVKAVEAATLKIQSTFRGKKIRSKFGAANKTEEPTQGPEVAPAAAAAPAKQVNKIAGQQQQQQTSCKTSTSKHKQPQQADETNELRERVGAMQVQDNGAEQPQAPGGLPEEEAERAATKIQAGFKGYKTRKELEVGGKLPPASTATQQAAPGDK